MTSLDNITRNVGGRYFPALGHRDFRFLWTAILLSDSGTWALITVRAVMARDIAEVHGDLWVGITVFAGMIPFIIVPPIAGYLADRFVRKHVLAFTFMLAWAQCVALTVLAFTGALELWHLVVLSFINGSARAVQTPTAFSLVANLVPRDLMINAYALNSATFHASRLVGPGLIAPLLATVEPGWVFAACNVPFILSLALVLGISTVSTGAMEASKGFLSNMIAGFSYVYRRPALTMIVLLITFHCGLTMSFEALLPVLSDERFGWGGSGVGYLMMAVGAGAMVSSIYLAGIRSERYRGRLLLTAGVLSALAPLALAVAPNMAIGMLAASVMGATQTAYMVITLTMMQSMVPDAVRGRISSIYIIHAGGIMSFANLGNGALAELADPFWLLSIGGIAFLAVTLFSGIGPTMRRIYWTGNTVPAPT